MLLLECAFAMETINFLLQYLRTNFLKLFAKFGTRLLEIDIKQVFSNITSSLML